MDSLKQLTIICVNANQKLWQRTLYTSGLFSYAFADASDIVITTQNAIQLSLFTYIDAFIKQIWYTEISIMSSTHLTKFTIECGAN